MQGSPRHVVHHVVLLRLHLNIPQRCVLPGQVVQVPVAGPPEDRLETALCRFGRINVKKFDIWRGGRAYYVALLCQNGYVMSAIRERPCPMPPIPKLTALVGNTLVGGK
jgi:hypothetical protein